MPRKQNGFGNTKSFAVKGAESINRRTDKGKGRGAAGSYPANRRYGSTVSRSVIEQYDLDSTWARWRRGMEYYYQGAYLEFAKTDAVLFQGTNFEIPVTFDGYRYATKNADSRTHYAIRRTVTGNKQLGFVDEIQSDAIEYPEQFANHEIWMKVVATRGPDSDSILVRCQGERITDGQAAANVKYVLTDERKPAVYDGKSFKDGIRIKVSVPLDEIMATDFIKNNNDDVDALVGEAVYMPDFFVNRQILSLDRFVDSRDFVEVDVADLVGDVRVIILDNETLLPPTLSEVGKLDNIFETSRGFGGMDGSFFFRKSDYQRFFGNQYLTADVISDEVDTLSYAITPFLIQSVKVNMDIGKSGVLEITSEPFQSSLKLYTPTATSRWVVLSDNSFTIQALDYDNAGQAHKKPVPGEKLWTNLKLGVNPWQDQTFLVGRVLVIAELYTCSCPAYLRAMIRSPEAYDEKTGRINRQARAPMPTARGANDYDMAGISKIAGITESWANAEYKRGFKVCKHTIASMFVNKIRVQEPNTLPSYETRLKFEEKLAADIQEVADEFRAQLERSEITTVEIVFALAEALNLDDIELGFVLATSSF